MSVTIDKQVGSRQCSGCGSAYNVVRGSAYNDGSPFGIYLIALHGHTPDGLIAHLAIVVLDNGQTELRPYAAAIDVFTLPDQFGFTFVPWSDSPWAGETYLGEMLSPEDARQSMFCGRFFEIAEHVIENLAEAQDYFTGRRPKPKRYSWFLRRLTEIYFTIRVKPEIRRRPTDEHRGGGS